MTRRTLDPVTSLETERLLLRPLQQSDTDDYAAMLAHPDVQEHLNGGTPVPRDEAWRSMAMMVGHGELLGYTNNAVILKETGEFVGRCGLFNPEGWPGIEVGWCLRRDAWGQGYATEAGAAWRDYAFTELGLDELISVIHVDNAGSQAVARRLGHVRQRDFQVREFPCQIWGQSRAQWEART